MHRQDCTKIQQNGIRGEISGERTEYLKFLPYTFLVQFLHNEGILL